MTLGQFGGSEAIVKRVSQGTGGTAISDAINEAQEGLLPSLEGQPATTPQFFLPVGNLGFNYVRNGHFKSWSAGASAAPNWWASTLGSVAKNTTDIQIGDASCDVSNSVGNAANLEQAVLVISSTQNTILADRFFTLTARVKASVSGRAFLEIDDGSRLHDSRYHSGSAAFETLVVSGRLVSAATQLKVRLRITSGAAMTATFSGVSLSEGKSPVDWTPHPNDDHLRITNVQGTTPANTTDLGDWRAEIGEVSLAGVVTQASVTKTVTYQAAFERRYQVLISPTSSGGLVGAKRCIWAATTSGASSFIADAATEDGLNFADTTSGTAYWQVIGAVAG